MRRIRRKRSLDYVLPFLILVGLGVIAVLTIQLIINFQKNTGDVYFYIVSGKAKMLQYGTTEWSDAFSGTKLLLGDSIKTAQNSRIVLQFYNGTIVRLGNDTSVTITDITKRGDNEKIGMALDYGMIWVNKITTEDIKISEFQVRTAHMLIHDTGTIFEVEKNSNAETARVIKGNIKIDIITNDKNPDQITSTIDVGVGQEINLDNANLKAFADNQNPSLLLAIRDDFKTSDWYDWNIKEDANPTDFARSEKTPNNNQINIKNFSSLQSISQETPATPDVNQNLTINFGQLSAPIITSPEFAKLSTDKSKLVISGTVEAGTAKVIVKQTVGGNTNEYTLSKFKVGDTTFSYNLNESYDNFKTGDNTYIFYAVDSKERRSDPTKITITYNKAAPTIIENLTTPNVLTFNGNTSSVVSTGVVKVVGEIHGAAKVNVNGYNLSKFQPGDTQWVYYANEQGGNLKAGLNEYEVYGIDANGKESDHAKFTITYNKTSETEKINP